jgi:hypothetical protein
MLFTMAKDTNILAYIGLPAGYDVLDSEYHE